MSEVLDDNLEKEENSNGFQLDFEEITPWNGANDTGKDVRMKWLRNFEKIRQNFELLSGLWSLKIDSDGKKYAYTNFPIVGAAGMTMFAGEEIKVDSIFKGLPLDTTTLQWVDGVLTVVGGTGGGEAGFVKWQNIEGKPSWITSEKPKYSYTEITGLTEELARYVTLSTDQSITGMKDFADGMKVSGTLFKVINGVLTLDCSIAVTGGITAYALGEQTAATIMDGVAVDGITITKEDGVLKVVGGGGASNWDELEGKPSWITDIKPVYTWGEITQKPTTLSGYGIQASDILNTLKTVDGSGSGLDADTLDGFHAMGTSGNVLQKRGHTVALTTPSWCRLAKFGSTSTENNTDTAFFLHSSFNDRYGILIIRFRGGERVTAHFLVSSGIDTTKIRVYYDDAKKNIELYYYAGEDYSNIIAELLYSTHRAGQYTNEITMYEADTTSPSYTNYVNPGYYSIQNNAASATKLFTARTIWGQRFDGTANVTGSLTSVTDITGTGTFTGANIKATDSVYVNGIRLHKTADGVITLEGNLAVTGGITQFAVNEVNPSTIMDGVVVDGTSIKKENGVLKVMNAGGGEAGSVKWANITDKPVTLAGYGVSASDVLSTLKTVDGRNSGLDADMLDGVHNGYVSGKLHTYSIPGTGADKYNYWVKIATIKLTKQYSSQESVLLINEQYGLMQNSLYAFIIIRMQQQDAMGDTPNVSLKAFGSIVNENIVGILNYNSSTSTFDIYYRQTYAYIGGYISYLQGSIDARTNSQELVATLPSGTQIISTNDCRCGYSLNSDKLDGVQLNGLFTALSSSSGTNLSITIGNVTKTIADLYATQAVNADTVDNYHAIGTSGNVIKKRGHTVALTTPTWSRLAKYSTTGTEYNTDMAFFLHSSFTNVYGILIIKLRGGEEISAGFLTSYQIDTSKVRIYYDDDKKNVELYYYAGERYSNIIAELLYSTDRSGKQNNSIIMYEGDETAPSYSNYTTPTFYSIQNNASSASKLQTARNLWGQSFDGTRDVTGSMTVNGNITIANGSSSTLTIWDSSAYIQQQNISDLGGYGLYLYGSSGTRIANKLVVDSNAYLKGNVGIGTISPSYKLDVSGTFRVTNTSVFNGNVGIGTTSPSQKLHVAGNILATGGGTFYSSDIRAKNVIESLKIKLNDIANAPVIKFRWNGYNGLKDDNKQHVGGIAQYIEKILPECVIGQKDDFLSFDYATTGYVFSVLTARHLLSYETRTDRIIRKLKERIRRLERQLNIENHEEVCFVAD